MENYNETQSRREFFKEAAKKALPILGAVALLSNPMIAKAMDSEPLCCTYGTCVGTCMSTCTGTCSGDCERSCMVGCKTSCQGTCKGTCLGTCDKSCKGTCAYSNRY